MRQIEIDDQVFAYLQSKAIPFEETPNLTLRRLFGLAGMVAQPNKLKPQVADPSGTRKTRRKEPKADLRRLVQAGLLHEGQNLNLCDYRGEPVSGYEATIEGKELLWNNRHWSMSELAKECLKKQGFTSESVRGPAHWCNCDGITVKELWKQYLGTYQT